MLKRNRITGAILGVVLIFITSPSASADPSSSYFSLYPKTAIQINEAFARFSVSLSAGLYFTDQQEAEHRGDLRGGMFNEVTLSLEREEGGGTLTVGLAGSYPQLELWAIRPGVGKYLLARFESEGGTKVRFKSSRFLANPRYFVPVDDGVVAFADDWILYRRHQHPDKATGKLRSATVNVRVLTQSFDDNAEVPILVHPQSSSKMLVAVWPKLPQSEEETSPSLVNLVLVDLENDRAKPMLNGLTWPFYLTEDGVYYVAGEVLAFRHFDWKAETFGPPKLVWLFNSALDRLVVGEKAAILQQPDSRGQTHEYHLSADGNLIP